ncbi:MAG: hypothetical protein K6F14_04840 [Clostridiales bacterium]|nr:hypothetical protein [Clostridiales bacterium]
MSSYCRTVSYNKLNLHADILDVYQTEQEYDLKSGIYETGHALGLNDYYDYDITKDDGCLGCFVMMDANAGDHDPY